MRQRPRYHLIYRVLAITGLVAVLPLSVGFLLIQHAAKTRLTDANGANFVWFAEHAASSIDLAFVRELEFLSSLSGCLAVTRPEEASRLLNEMESALYRGLVVLDTDGHVVAASEGADYDPESERPSFSKALNRARNGSGLATSFGEWEEGADFFVLYRPIRDAESGQARGLVRATLDAERLFNSVSDFRFGETGHACLMDASMGRLVAGSATACAAESRYARFSDYERAQSQGNRYFLGNVAGPGSFDRGHGLLVAFARPDLSFALPEHDWVVLVEQALTEANAPLTPMGRDLIFYFLAMGVLVVLLAAYLSYRMERPEADVRVDLHQH